jgi:mRNA interferase MazF
MTSFEAGDVVDVPFPFIDRPVRKRRPALVLSIPAAERDKDVVVLAMITSAKRSSWPSDVPITEPTTAGLNGRSVVRWKMFSIESSHILSVRGRLSGPDFAGVADRFQELFGSWVPDA